MHFLTIKDTPLPLLKQILSTSRNLRDVRGTTQSPTLLTGKSIATLFEKPSLRTRVSFEVAMHELGGHAVVLGRHEVGLGERESVKDITQVLEGMVQGIAARVFLHEHLQEMARHSSVPVINMLSDSDHPTQALADILTMMDEFGEELAGKRVTFVGDGNNVSRSLAELGVMFGMHITLASPQGYGFSIAEQASLNGLGTGSFVEMRDPEKAVKNADVIYADTFVSMGQEAETTRRMTDFCGYQINDALMAIAPVHAIFMHCLPAHRGIEVTDGVMDGAQSRIYRQAHHRLHAQKGLLATLLATDNV